ncbi:MAG TPA: hypothetical protein VLI72_02810 [Methylibium sp.]|nr:hypothetical protein [Methylibium sp.]
MSGFACVSASRALAALALAWVASASPAWAGSPAIEVLVSPVPQIVTRSRPEALPALPTRAAYEVTLTNRSSNVINELRFVASTTVQGAATTAPFAESIGFACSATGPTATSCSFGKLLGKGDQRRFVLVFNAPTAGNTITLNWTASYGEGSKDSTGASHRDTQTGSALTTLGTPIATEVKSYVATSGGTLFTGQTGVATFGDPWTTTVQVPSFARAEVLETTSPQSCSAEYKVCVTSTLTIPGSFAYLSIVLRRDVSTLQTGANIANAVLRYEPGTTDASGNFVPSGPPLDIVSCDLLPERLPNAANRRCLDYRRVYGITNSPTIDWKGDWEFGLRALENGRISF